MKGWGGPPPPPCPFLIFGIKNGLDGVLAASWCSALDKRGETSPQPPPATPPSLPTMVGTEGGTDRGKEVAPAPFCTVEG